MVVEEMRKKFDSIAEKTMPLAEQLNAKIDRLVTKIDSHPPDEDTADTEPKIAVAEEKKPEGETP